jgi:hypothetical protein
MTENIIYYHIYTINNWLEIVKEQINLVQSTNLLKNSILRVGVLYDNEKEIDEVKNFFVNYKNIEFLFFSINSGYAESETLSMMKKFSDQSQKNYNVLYLHTKGVTQYNSVRELPVKEWRNMMEYFLIEKWNDCIDKLNQGYDCCGINLKSHTGNIRGKLQETKIFDGNFFWTKTDYVKKLDESLLFEHRYSAENWITSSNPNLYSFYNSPIIDLYYQIDKNYK